MLKSRNDVRIVIVGAGLAGLSAASQLIKNGFNHTIILEATGRLGGRINSVYFGDVYCELGAKWISIDASKDSAYEMISKTSRLKPKVLKKNEKYYCNDQGERVQQSFQKKINLMFKYLCYSIKNKYQSGVLQYSSNIQTLKAESDKAIKSMFEHNERNLAFNIYSKRIRQFSSLMGCCLEHVNIEHMIKWYEESTSPIYLPTGMDNILYDVTSNFDRKLIKFEHPVNLIKWFDSIDCHVKTVTCLNGSHFFADHIICTLPLGVLKNFSQYIFFPTLPEKKINSIKNLGLGCPLKMYIEYEKYIRPWFFTNIRPFWPSGECCKKFIWTKQIIEISKIATSCRVLEITIAGPYFEEIEKLPDTEILIDVTLLLRRCLNNPSVPCPVSLLRSNWNSNACFLGGKPYISTRSTINDVEELAVPLGEPPTLLFAGDGTILNGFGSIDGARRSGLREAQRIVKYYNIREYTTFKNCKNMKKLSEDA